MFKKVLEYAGEYRRTTYASIAVMLLGVVMSVLPYFFIYRLIAPPLTGEMADPGSPFCGRRPSPCAECSTPCST